ncbi:MAG TPA: response regulator [Verrucomicrobiae bacterium]
MSESIENANVSPTAAATILLVDDNPLVLAAYRGALARRGYQVETAADGLEAMRKVASIRPALVVLDLLMPKIDGAYVLKFIRSQSQIKKVPVIVLSDATIADAAKTALDQHPDAVFLKSQCTATLLADKIAELLGRAGSGTPAA